MANETKKSEPLFPSTSGTFALALASDTNSDWLRNTSFTLPANALQPPTAQDKQTPAESPKEEHRKKKRKRSRSRSPSPGDHERLHKHKNRHRSKKHHTESEDKHHKHKEKRTKLSDKEKIILQEQQVLKGVDPRGAPQSSFLPVSKKSLVGTGRAFLEDMPPGGEPYFIDTKGDTNNLVFGSLYRMDIPLYHRRRFVLGLAPFERIVIMKKAGYVTVGSADKRTGDDDREQVLGTERYINRNAIAIERDVRWKRLRILPSTLHLPPPTPGEYIPLSSADKTPAPSDSQHDEHDIGESYEDFLTHRRRELNQRTREHPHSVDAWLALVEFQDLDFVDAVDEHTAAAFSLTATARRRRQRGAAALAVRIAEKKLSIYERAIAAAGPNERLVVGMLATAERLWDADKLLAKWEQAVAHNPGSALLWQRYVRFRQSHFASFATSAVRSVVTMAIRTAAVGNATTRSFAAEEALVDYVAMATAFDRRTGYTERAVATFQALLELNFGRMAATRHADHPMYNPATDVHDVDSDTAYYDDLERVLADFGEFWETDQPRVGDAAAAGWLSWKRRRELEAIRRRNTALLGRRGLRDHANAAAANIREYIAHAEPPEAEESEDDAMRSEEEDDEVIDSDNDDGDSMPANDSRAVAMETERVRVPPPQKANRPATTQYLTLSAMAEAKAREEANTGKFEAFSQLETAREQRWWAPARPLHREADQSQRRAAAVISKIDQLASVDRLEEDPDRVVLFEDIRDSLVLFANTSSVFDVFELLVHFVADSNVLWPCWEGTVLLRRRRYRSTVDKWSAARVAESESVEPVFALFSEPRSGSVDVENVRKLLAWHNNPVSTCRQSLPRLSADREQFVRNVFHHGMAAFEGTPWGTSAALLFAAFEFSQNGAGAAKATVKSLLRSQRTNFQLWNVFAQLEYLDGRLVEARRVYDMAISAMSSDRSSSETAPLLFRCYAEMEMEVAMSGQPERGVDYGKVATIVCAAVEENYASVTPASAHAGTADQSAAFPPPTRLLRARKAYEQQLFAPPITNRLDDEQCVHMTVCYALLQYVTMGFEKACEVFDQVLAARFGENTSEKSQNPSLAATSDPMRAYAFEALFAAYVKLVTNHFLLCTTPPQRVRAVVLRALSHFPANPLFLSLLVFIDGRGQLEARLRRYFDRACARAAEVSPIVWLFAVRVEAGRPGATNRVRALFERALEPGSDSAAAHCAAVWRAYIAEELARNQPEAAKRVFFRAVRYAPHSKRLWMDAMATEMRRVITKTELTELVDLMSEKELRLRSDLREVE